MRIISGTHGGRKFHPPTKIPARPTTDIAKEGLFNTLQNNVDFEGIKTLDIFGGTGSISFELASRGASDLTLVEQDRKTINFIKKAISEFGFKNFKVVSSDVFKFLKNCKDQYDFIFAGPPYALKEIDSIPEKIFDYELLLPSGIFVLEHTPRNNYEHHPNFERVKNYGTTVFSFFKEVGID